MPRSGTTTEGRAKLSRWHEQPQGRRLPPVAAEFDEQLLIPPPELIDRLAGQVAVHLMAGRWGLAHAALIAGEREARQLLGKPDVTAMSIGERLMLPATEMCLDNRTTNMLEDSGRTTVGQIRDAWPLIDCPNFGIESRTRVAKVLVDWNLLTDAQVRQAAKEGLINRWWPQHGGPDEDSA